MSKTRKLRRNQTPEHGRLPSTDPVRDYTFVKFPYSSPERLIPVSPKSGNSPAERLWEYSFSVPVNRSHYRIALSYNCCRFPCSSIASALDRCLQYRQTYDWRNWQICCLALGSHHQPLE